MQEEGVGFPAAGMWNSFSGIMGGKPDWSGLLKAKELRK